MSDSFVSSSSGKTRQPVIGQVGYRRARRFEVAVFLLAFVLIAVSTTCGLLHWRHLSGSAGERFRLLVIGPGKFAAGAPAHFVIETTTITGQTLPASVSFGLYYENGRRMTMKDVLGADGRLHFTLPAEQLAPGTARLEIAAEYRKRREFAQWTVPISPAHYVAHAQLSAMRCYPGDTISYRVVVFSAWQLVPAQRLETILEIAASGAAEGAVERHLATVQAGIAAGRLKVGTSCPPGRYVLQVRSEQANVTCRPVEFEVLPRPDNAAEVCIVFDRRSYRPGHEAQVKVLYRNGSAPQEGVSLQLHLRSGEEILYRTQGVTDAAGQWVVSATLPESPPQQPLLAQVYRTGEDRTVLASEPVPLDDGSTILRFFPEGGVLVPDVENRIYFSAEDPFGNPVEVSGTVADSRGNTVAVLKTLRPGFGSFSLAPLPGEQYRAELRPPRKLRNPAHLPVAVLEHRVAVNAGLGVFDAEDPLRFTLRTNGDRLPLVAVVWCRGLAVACQALTRWTTNHANGEEIPLPDGIFGPMRLAIYDCHTRPFRVVAQRWVFRRPPEDRSLSVQLVAGRREYRAGDPVAVEVQLRSNRQQASNGIVGVMALEGPLAHVDQPPDHPLAQLLFEPDFGQQLAHLPWHNDGRFEQRSAAVALDLWLGTRPVATAGSSGSLSEPLPGQQSRDWQSELEPVPPLVFDNLEPLQQQFHRQIERQQNGRPSPLRITLRIAAVASLGLLILVVMIVILDITTSVWFWSAGLVAAAVCVAIDTATVQPVGYLGDEVPVPYVSQEPRGPARENSDAVEMEKAEGTSQSPEESPGKKRPGQAEWFDFESSGQEQATAAGKPPLLFWDPAMPIGNSGRGTIGFDLPPYPGRCRVTVTAHNNSGAFGIGELAFPWSAATTEAGESP